MIIEKRSVYLFDEFYDTLCLECWDMFLTFQVCNLSSASNDCRTDQRISGRGANRSANTLDRILNKKQVQFNMITGRFENP